MKRNCFSFDKISLVPGERRLTAHQDKTTHGNIEHRSPFGLQTSVVIIYHPSPWFQQPTLFQAGSKADTSLTAGKAEHQAFAKAVQGLKPGGGGGRRGITQSSIRATYLTWYNFCLNYSVRLPVK